MLHQETPSPLTPLGAKGIAEGNCMSVPACIANAIADALQVRTCRCRHPAPHPRAHGRREARVRRPRERTMKPRPFDYVRPDTVEEAVAVLAEHGEAARVLAGGQSLIAMLNLRLVEPAVLVDITRIAELDGSGDRRRGRDRRCGDAEPAFGLARARRASSACRRRPAVRRPLPDPQQGGTVSLGRACRSELGDPAFARAAGGRGGAALEAEGTRVLAAHDFQHGMLTPPASRTS